VTTILTLIGLLLTPAALCLSIFALVAARRTLGPSLLKRLSALSTRVESLEADLDLLRQQNRADLKRLHARLAMQKFRDKGQTSSESPSGTGSGLEDGSAGNSEDDKARIRRELGIKLATGQLTAGVPINANKR